MAAHPTFPLVIIGRKDGIAITCQGTYTGDVIPQVPNIHSGQNIQNILIKVCRSVNGPETVCVIRTINPTTSLGVARRLQSLHPLTKRSRGCRTWWPRSATVVCHLRK